MQVQLSFLDVIVREFPEVKDLIVFAQKEKTLETAFYWELMQKTLD